MWAMIAASIALGIWTAALSYTTAKLQKRHRTEMAPLQQEEKALNDWAGPDAQRPEQSESSAN